jgi:hypothetical protein
MLEIFMYQDRPFMKVIPSKTLFRSTTIHEVVNRGDFFAVNMTTGILTVLPQGANKEKPAEVPEDSVAKEDWIDADVTLPPPRRRFLALFSSGYVDIRTMRTQRIGKQKDGDKITHWKPLPKAPIQPFTLK